MLLYIKNWLKLTDAPVTEIRINISMKCLQKGYRISSVLAGGCAQGTKTINVVRAWCDGKPRFNRSADCLRHRESFEHLSFTLRYGKRSKQSERKDFQYASVELCGFIVLVFVFVFVFVFASFHIF